MSLPKFGRLIYLSAAGGGGNHLAAVPCLCGKSCGLSALLLVAEVKLRGVAAAFHAHNVHAPAVLFLKKPGASALGTLKQIVFGEYIHAMILPVQLLSDIDYTAFLGKYNSGLENEKLVL